MRIDLRGVQPSSAARALYADGTVDYDGAYWLVNAFCGVKFARCAMVCSACGAAVMDGARFCARCGAAAAPHPGQVYGGQPAPVAGVYGAQYAPRPRIQPRLQTLGTLWCVYALYRVVSASIAMLMLRAVTLHSLGGLEWPLGHEFGQAAPTWMEGLLPVVAVVIVVGAALATFAGWSLLERKPWGRTLSIVTAILALLKFPFGTALGIYTLWVMVPAESAMEWETIADRSE